MVTWNGLVEELDVWAEAGRMARFWWRDDDAVEVTAPLERLLDMAHRRSVPLALAVIPIPATPDLLRRLRREANVSVLQHGVSHRNHAPAGEKKAELGPHRDITEVVAELAEGRRRLAAPMVDDPPSVLVPPWNRISADLTRRLPEIGLRGLSTFGARSLPQPVAGLRQTNTHADLIDWKGSRGFVGTDVVLRQIVGHLWARRQGQAEETEPTGLLTHHLVHDEACWHFIESLLEVTQEHPAAVWLGAPEIFALPC